MVLWTSLGPVVEPLDQWLRLSHHATSGELH
jgi:hypothetical protein